jgi:putative nucleotidyltransferase with HDIG domain
MWHMTSRGKKIPIDELKEGMYVADVFNEKDILLFSARTLITNERQIETLKKQGVTSLNIFSDELSTHAADDADAHAKEESEEAEKPSVESVVAFVDYQRQLKEADALHTEALETVRETMGAVKMGRIFSARNVAKMAERVAEKVLDDPDIYFGLSMIKAAGNDTYTHSLNVSMITTAFAGALNYPAERIADIAMGSLLHDIGKMKLPEALWMKNERCTRKEFELFMQHPLLGVAIIDNSNQKLPGVSKKIIAQHHERWNGGGYPSGLRDEQIHEAALMCALADRYDLLTTKTPFHHACIPQEALARIFRSVEDGEYPRLLVEQFTRLLGIYPIGSFVKLQSGEKGMVIRIHRSSLLTPVVLILFNKQGKRLEKPFVRDLLAGSAHSAGHIQYKVEVSLDPQAMHFNPAQLFSAIAG